MGLVSDFKIKAGLFRSGGLFPAEAQLQA